MRYVCLLKLNGRLIPFRLRFWASVFLSPVIITVSPIWNFHSRSRMKKWEMRLSYYTFTDIYRQTWLQRRTVDLSKKMRYVHQNIFTSSRVLQKIFTAINLERPLISLTSTRQAKIGNGGAHSGRILIRISSQWILHPHPIVPSKKGYDEKWTNCRLRKPNFSFTKGGLFCVRSVSQARDRKHQKQRFLTPLPHSSWECHYVNEAIHNITNIWPFVMSHPIRDQLQWIISGAHHTYCH